MSKQGDVCNFKRALIILDAPILIGLLMLSEAKICSRQKKTKKRKQDAKFQPATDQLTVLFRQAHQIKCLLITSVPEAWRAF